MNKLATCGGGGISDNFGAGLWVMDYLLQGAMNQVERLYFHQGTIGNCVSVNSKRCSLIYFRLVRHRHTASGVTIRLLLTMELCSSQSSLDLRAAWTALVRDSLCWTVDPVPLVFTRYFQQRQAGSCVSLSITLPSSMAPARDHPFLFRWTASTSRTPMLLCAPKG